MVFAMYQLESATCPPILDLPCTTLPTPSLWLSQSKSLFKKKKKFLFIFGCAGSSLLYGLFSSCSKGGLLSNYDVQAALVAGHRL